MLYRNLCIMTVAGLGLTACQITPPDLADRARSECRDEARDQDYRNIDLGQAFGDNRVVMSISGERNGRQYSGSCTYDRRDREATLDMSRGDDSDSQLLSRGRDACRDEAQDRNYRLRSIDNGRVSGDSARFNLQLTRNGNSYSGYCRYRNGDVDLEIERG